MANTLFKAGKQPPTPFSPNALLLEAALSSSIFHKKVQVFTDAFSGWSDLIDYGQGVYARLYRTRLLSDFSFWVDSLVIDQELNKLLRKEFDTALDLAKEHTYKQDQYALAKDCAALAGFDLDPATRLILAQSIGLDQVNVWFPGTAFAAANMKAIEAEVRDLIGKIIGVTDLDFGFIPDFKSANVYHYMVATGLQLDRCFATVGGIANKFVREVNPAPIAPYGRLYGDMTVTIPDGGKKTNDTLFHRVNPSVVKYRPKTATQVKTLNTLSDHLDAGHVLRAGLLSGKTYGRPLDKYSDPEHYVLLVASHPFPEYGAVAFLFWDPDSQSSNIEYYVAPTPRLPKSFGVLFAFYATTPVVHGEPNGVLMFSTAFSGADSLDLWPIDQNFHYDYRMRHRYQVLSLYPPTPVPK